jgi:hypothetical protein
MPSIVMSTGDAKGSKENMVPALRWKFSPKWTQRALEQEFLIVFLRYRTKTL